MNKNPHTYADFGTIGAIEENVFGDGAALTARPRGHYPEEGSSAVILPLVQSNRLPIALEAVPDLPLVDYIDWMLSHGWYDVDVATGVVSNPRTRLPLKPRVGHGGYLQVTLVYRHRIARTVRVHRMVAVKLWGADAVRSADVAHLDGDRGRNVDANLALMARADHVRFDRLGQPNHKLRKTRWSPCCRCGDPDGPMGRNDRTPRRISGLRFGVSGIVCGRCYGALRRAALKAVPSQ